MKRLLLFTLLAGLSCGRMATDHLLSKNFHGWLEPFDLQPEDAGRIEQGWLPLLVLMDGKPCPNALTLVEPIPAGNFPIPESLIARTGQRDDVLNPNDPGIVRTDARGIVWWQPIKDHFVYRLSASSGERIGSFILVQHRMKDFRAAARQGLAHQAIELLPLRSWKVDLLAPEGMDTAELPLFLVSPEGRVLARMPWTSDGTVTGFDVANEPMKEDDEFLQILAGFDRSQMKRVESKRTSSRHAFDLRQTGGFTVELLGLDGGPVTEPRAVFLEDLDAAVASEWNGMASHLANAPSVVAVGGSAALHGVPLGKRWRISAFTQGDHAAVMKEVDGPARADEMKIVRLDAAESSVSFRGRILEPDGSPAAGVACRLKADGDVFAPLQTDAEGRFSTQIPLWILNRGKDMNLQCDRRPLRPICSVRISAADLADHDKVKDLRFTEMEPLATGRVVDENGAGVGWASLSNWDSGGLSSCDGDGYFLLEAEPDRSPDQDQELDADSPWHMEESVRFRTGDRDLVVQVRTGARISGVLDGALLVPNVYWKYLLPGSDKLVDGIVMHDWKGLHGEFEIGPIPQEATKVQIKFATNDETIGTVTLKDLRLEAGKVYQLPKPVQLDK